MQMDHLIRDFPAQLKSAVDISRSARLTIRPGDIRHILVSGMGGSGIGGRLACELTDVFRPVPMQVNNDYHLPGWVNEHTLVIISSYSGNTEETCEALKEARKRQVQLVCITSNGKVAEAAKQHQLDCIRIPGGIPPRAALGYSLTQQLSVLRHLGFSEQLAPEELIQVADRLGQQQQSIQKEAQKLAGKLSDKLPVIYTEQAMEAVAWRYRQQLNENAKMLCWHHLLPEMNHNEVVGWRDKQDKVAVLFLCRPGTYARTSQRFDITRHIVQKHTAHIHDITAPEANDCYQRFYLIHFGDWLSFYLAEARGHDAVEVKVIDYLKGELKK